MIYSCRLLYSCEESLFYNLVQVLVCLQSLLLSILACGYLKLSILVVTDIPYLMNHQHFGRTANWLPDPNLPVRGARGVGGHSEGSDNSIVYLILIVGPNIDAFHWCQKCQKMQSSDIVSFSIPAVGCVFTR